MLPELGHFSLIMALCLAAIQGFVPLIGAARNMDALVAVARPAALGQFLFLLAAFLSLAWAFAANDFSVAYVAQNSNSLLPAVYRISAVWGGHEGSLLLWAFLLAGWTLAVVVFSRHLPHLMVARVLGVMGLISTGFLAFLVFTSNPFNRLWPVPPDGRDLNPLLQDIGLVLHPPMLYMGYVGFSVAFAFAVAALLGGRLDATWARWSRPWTTVAWAFMTLGICLGSWWAYYELGWGGWWFWDPVENASLMPWLTGTALIHSLAVSEKRAAFKNWTVLLAIITFSLSLLGTFLVRSGVVTSVHAFADDPKRGVFTLVLLAVTVGSSLLLYAWRAPQVRNTGQFALVSRESMLLGNNVVLTVAAGSVMLGTLYPLLLEALGLGRISVGPPYFNTVFVPLMLPLLCMLAVGSLVRWKRDSVARLQQTVRATLAASLILGGLLPWWLFGSLVPMAMLGSGLAAAIIGASLLDLRWRLRNSRNVFQGMRRLTPGFWGMMAAHAGVAVTVIGIAFSSHFSHERDVRLAPGDSYELGGYRFLFEEVGENAGPNYRSTRAGIRISRKGMDDVVLHTEKRIYTARAMPMTEAGIDWGVTRDLYVALGEPLGQGAWAMRLSHKPFVRWVWFGPLLMALGGLLAAVDRRYRLKRNAMGEVVV